MKVMSKMGISTYQSYCGAQIFDAVGPRRNSSTSILPARPRASKASVSRKSPRKSRAAIRAFGMRRSTRLRSMSVANTPIASAAKPCLDRESVSTLQHAMRGNSLERYKAFAKIVNEQSERMKTMRGLFRIKTAEDEAQAHSYRRGRAGRGIVKRFSTGAMSFGSISREAHTTLAIAMNRIGGNPTPARAARSDRFMPSRTAIQRSAIKQVASGRFGVTTEYLVNSDMMQIKMAQGAKPGEGGQLPGHKVDPRLPGCGIRRLASVLSRRRRTMTSILSKIWHS